MDGTTPFQAFHLVVAPLAIPGTVIAATLVLIFTWNDLLLAVSLILTEVVHTAPAAVTNFIGSSQFDESTGSIAAATIVITTLTVIFVAIFQHRIVAGPAFGAVKD